MFWNTKKKKNEMNANRKQVPNDQRNSKLLPFYFGDGWDSVEVVRDYFTTYVYIMYTFNFYIPTSR